jgi:hypothetical protein
MSKTQTAEEWVAEYLAKHPDKTPKQLLDEMMAQPIPKRAKPKPVAPAAEVVAGPWPRRQLTEWQIIENQRQIDYWWELHKAQEAERLAEPSPDKKLSDWIWGRDR